MYPGAAIVGVVGVLGTAGLIGNWVGARNMLYRWLYFDYFLQKIVQNFKELIKSKYNNL